MNYFLEGNTIKSDQGYQVEVLGQTGVRFTYNNDFIIIDSEFLAGPEGLVIYSSSIDHWTNSTNKIDNEEKNKIINAVVNAFKFREIEIVVL